MLKKLSVLIGIACCICCHPHRPGLQPDAGPSFRSLGIKFSFNDGSARQNGRIHWRFDDHCAKFIFFTALNQVGLELDADGESALLINFTKKAFWRGDFMVLLDRLWGIELELAQLKQLLLEGLVPQAAIDRQGLIVSLKKNTRTGAPEVVRLQRGSSDLTLRIYKNERRPGKLVFIDYEERYRAADLESVLDDD